MCAGEATVPPAVVEAEPADAAAGASRSHLYVIIGATLGGIVVLLASAFVAFVFCRQRPPQTGTRAPPRVDHGEKATLQRIGLWLRDRAHTTLYMKKHDG